MNLRLKSFVLLAVAAIGMFASCMQEAESPSQSSNAGLASVSEQVMAIRASMDVMEDMQAVLEQDIKNGQSALSNLNSELLASKAELEAHLGYLQAEDSAYEATVATLLLQKNIAQLVGNLKAHNLYQTLTEELSASVESWIGTSFDDYYEACVLKGVAMADIQALMNAIVAQKENLGGMLSDIEAGLRNGVEADEVVSLVEVVEGHMTAADELVVNVDKIIETLEEECLEAISQLLDNENDTASLKKAGAQALAQMKSASVTLNDLVARVEACEAQVESIKTRLGELEADVNELLGMIQSLTFVSDYATENAIAYYEMDLDTKVSDPDVSYNGKAKRTAKGSIELSYFVRPASAAKALNANTDVVSVIGYYAKNIAVKSVSASDYIDFTVDKVAVVDENRGLITVTVTPDLKDAFYYKEVGAKCALSINSGMTDITSKFVEIIPMDYSTNVYVTSITPSTTYVEIDKGETYTLSATVAPSNANIKSYSWTSSNANVVTVDQSTGLLTAVGVGEAVVTATSHGVDEWGLPLTAECRVKVNEAFRLSGPPYVEIGYTADLILDYPASAIVESKVWKSSDTSKAVVDQNGKVTGVGNTYLAADSDYGSVTISCTINGVTTVSHNLKVVVTQPKAIRVTGLADDQNTVTMRVDESFSLASTIYPENVDPSYFRLYYSSDQGLGWIDSSTGMINGGKNMMSPTTAWVYIDVFNQYNLFYFAPGVSLRRTVTVKVLPYLVKAIQLTDVEMQPGQTVTLSPKFTSDVDGKTPTNTVVTWSSDNENVATVDQHGVVTSLTAGTVHITATATDGTGVSGTCTVNITQPWKDFEVGNYVVRTSSGDIDFAADYNAAISKGSVVGVVVAKTNPRATDVLLPASCTHGVAIALGEGEGKWWSGAPSSSPYKVYEWAIQNGYQSTMGVDWSSSMGTHRSGTAELYVGYNNTLALKEFLSERGLTSEMISALNAYNGPKLPDGASSYYLPSVAEMDAIAAVSNNSWALSDKLSAAGGTKFTNAAYWTVSDSGNSSSNAAKVNPLTGALDGAGMKTNAAKFRYVFAF